MKKSLSSILLLIAIIMAGCTIEKIGMDPTADGREMMYECLSKLKEGDAEKANAVIAPYLEIYTSRPLSERLAFCKASSESYWYEMIGSSDEGWKEFLDRIRPLMEWYVHSGTALSSLPNFNRLHEFQVATIAEATPPEPIRMEIENPDSIKAHADSIVVKIINETDGKVTFGEMFWLERQEGNDWVTVPYNPAGPDEASAVWNAVAYIIFPQSTSRHVDHTGFFNKNLTKGDYRLCRTVNPDDDRTRTDTLRAEFRILE